MFWINAEEIPIYPVTIFRNDRLYGGVLMYLFCGKKIYNGDTMHINGMCVGRKRIVEYLLNSPYSNKKCCLYDSDYPVRDDSIQVIDNLIDYVKRYFSTHEYSVSTVERLQLDIFNDLDVGTLVSPYVIREMCKLYRII